MVIKSTLRGRRFKKRSWISGIMGILIIILLQGVSNRWMRTAAVTLMACGVFLVVQRLSSDRRRLLHLATLDELTGLGNFRAYQERMRLETQRALRKNLPLTLILIDLDQFKNYNDTFGHGVGNELLHSVGQIFFEAIRAMDGVYRFGGDEFAVVLPETDLEEARHIADRIQNSFEGLPKRSTVTLSMGMANYQKESLEAFFDRVDHLLYNVKIKGGNCCQYEPSEVYLRRSYN